MPVTSAFTRVLRERVRHADLGASHASKRHRRSARSSSGVGEQEMEGSKKGEEDGKAQIERNKGEDEIARVAAI